MSIVATVKVYDGIVMGAESMTQLLTNMPGNPQPVCIKAYSHAQKIFRIANLPIGVLTYGGGNIGNRSMESFVHEFSQIEQELPPDGTDFSVQAVATRLCTFMNEHYEPVFAALPQQQRPQIGFYLAGYSPGQHLSSEWEFVLPLAQVPTRAREDHLIGASWRGISLPFARLFFGVDPRIEQILVGLGMNQVTIGQFRTAVSQQLTTKVAFEGMPIQDAIAFCKYIIDTTIGAATFEIGVPTCGGPVNVAVITRNGFQWVSQPKFTLPTTVG